MTLALSVCSQTDDSARGGQEVQDVACYALIGAIQKKDPHGLILKDFHQTGGTKKVPDKRAPY